VAVVLVMQEERALDGQARLGRFRREAFKAGRKVHVDRCAGPARRCRLPRPQLQRGLQSAAHGHPPSGDLIGREAARLIEDHLHADKSERYRTIDTRFTLQQPARPDRGLRHGRARQASLYEIDVASRPPTSSSLLTFQRPCRSLGKSNKADQCPLYWT